MKKILVAALTAAAAASSQAYLVSRDYKATGDGKLTYESTSNVNWLDLSESRGMSVADFLAGARGLNASFRLPNDAEVQGLFLAAGMSTRIGFDPATYDAALNLIGLLNTDNTTCYAQAACGLYRGASGTTLFNIAAEPGWGGLNNTTQNVGNLTYSNSWYGLMLIQTHASTIPEPSSMALVALALAALGGLARQRKTVA